MFKHCYQVDFGRMRADKRKVGFSVSSNVPHVSSPLTDNRRVLGTRLVAGVLLSVHFHRVKSQRGTKIAHNSSIAKRNPNRHDNGFPQYV